MSHSFAGKGNALAKNVPQKKSNKSLPRPIASMTTSERSQNRKSRHEYEVLDTLECGIVLVGSEVKSCAVAGSRSTRLTAA